MSDVRLINGDCLQVLPTLEAASVDMVCADPPYGTTACKWDTVIPLEPLWEELKRVIKPRGAIVMTASQPFTSALVMSNREWFRYEWIWEKSHPTGILHAKKRPLQYHEHVLCFSEGQGTYNPLMGYGKRCHGDKRHLRGHRYASGSMVGGNSVACVEHVPSENKYPRSVQRFDSVNRAAILHPTQKPVALMEYLIRTYTNEGETVLDFCMGSSTTGVACIQTGRRFVGIEIDAGYFAIAQKRIAEAQAACPLFPNTGA